MADTQATTPDPINSTLAKYPFLREAKESGERAAESKILAQSEQAASEFGEKAKALEKISAEDKTHYEDVKKDIKPIPEFKPSKENMMDLGGIFSMIGTMGVALGGSGKLSGLNAMNAMGGMLKGYQQGRKDLFAKEQATFEKELQTIKASNDALLKDLEQYQKLRSTDKEAALTKAAEISAKNPGVIAKLVQSSRDDVAKEIALKGADMWAKIMEASARHNLTSGGTDQAQLIKEFTGASLDKKAVPEVANLAKAVGQADDLSQYAKQNADLIGRYGQINQQIER